MLNLDTTILAGARRFTPQAKADLVTILKTLIANPNAHLDPEYNTVDPARLTDLNQLVTDLFAGVNFGFLDSLAFSSQNWLLAVEVLPSGTPTVSLFADDDYYDLDDLAPLVANFFQAPATYSFLLN